MDCSRFIALTFLFLFPFVGLALALECKPTQYPWKTDQKCCDKCPPGQYLYNRDEDCKPDCRPCTGPRYTDSYNIDKCIICSDCNKENMEYVSRCNSTHNAVCRCKPGFMCEGKVCNYCTASPVVTSRPTVPPVPKPTVRTPPKPIQDTAWFLIIICLLCVGLALVIVTKIKPLLNWITHNKSYCVDRQPVSVPAPMHYTQEEEEEEEEEEACVPVQEMFGKWDQPIEV